MSIEIVGVTLLWIFLYGYIIIAAIDFGTGLFVLCGKLTGIELKINPLSNQYLTPLWGMTNVFFIFFFIGLIGLFPDTAYYFGTALLVPGSIALLLISFRGSFYSLYKNSEKYNDVYLFFYGVIGLLIPATLSTALTLSEGGYIMDQGKKVVFLTRKLFVSPYNWSVIFLAIVSVFFISSAFLTFYANRANEPDSQKLVSKMNLFWGIPTIISCLFVFMSLRRHNPRHFDNMIEIWWVFGLSLVFFLIAIFLINKQKWLGWAFISVLFQYFFAFFGYGASHLPYILDPFVDVYTSFAARPTAITIIVVLLIGLLLTIPAIVWFMRIFLNNEQSVDKVKEASR